MIQTPARQRDHAGRQRAGAVALVALLLAACSEPAPSAPRVVDAAATARPPAATSGTRCEPSYPGICIPPPPPDLDCRDIPHRRFTVRPPDPHGFDSDRDGVGCEN